MPLPKIAIFDLTDCEGCELQIVALKEQLLNLSEKVEIVSWRLAQEDGVPDKSDKYDVAIVEGTPLTKHDVKLLNQVRKQAKWLIALGACAHLGGVNSIAEENKRLKLVKKIYSPKYKLKVSDAKPLSAYVKVDAIIPGCPADFEEVKRCLAEIAIRRKPKAQHYTVCWECKFNQNHCLLLDGEPCLGPIIRSGCGAVCTSQGIPCYGCWGILKGTNVKGLKKQLERTIGKREIERRMEIFLGYEMRGGNPD